MDIFDQIHQEETGGRMPDIFDRIHAESQESPPSNLPPVKVEPTPEDKERADKARETFDAGNLKIERKPTEEGPYEPPPVEFGAKEVGLHIAKKAVPSLAKVAYSMSRMIGEGMKADAFDPEIMQKHIDYAKRHRGIDIDPREYEAKQKQTISYKVGSILSDWGKEMSEEVEKDLIKLSAEIPEELRGRLIENPEYLINPKWMALNVGDAAVSLVPIIAASMLGGPAAGGFVGGSMEGGDLYDELRKEGVSHEDAAFASTAFGLVTGVLNAVGAKGILTKKVGTNFALRVLGHLKAGTVEMGTEYLEEPFQAAFGGIAEGKTTPEIIADIGKSLKNIEVMPGSFLLGSGGSIVSTAVTPEEKISKEPPKEPMQAVPGEEAPQILPKTEIAPREEIIPAPIPETRPPLAEEIIPERQEILPGREEIKPPISEEVKPVEAPVEKPIIEKVKLSTGKEVPNVKDLTDQQLWKLTLTPIERNMPKDVANYLTAAHEEFMARPNLKTKTPPPTQAKQPWEMTREEFYPLPDNSAAVVSKEGNVYTAQTHPTALTELEKAGDTLPENPKMGYELNRKFFEDKEGMGDFRKQIIQQALSEGKPVPPEVLAEYPDLKAPIIEEARGMPEETKEVEKELGSEINQVMDEISQKGAITFRTPAEKIKVPKFDNAETEARFQAAKGMKKEPLSSRAVHVLEVIKNRAMREYEHLPKGEKYARLRNDLLLLSKQKGISGDKALRAIQGITIELDKSEFDAFTRKVILDDLAYTAEKDMSLPFGLTKESLAQEKGKVDMAIAESPVIQRALEKRKRMWTAIKNEYIRAMKDIGFDVSERFKNEDYFRHQVLEYANLKGIVGAGRKLGVPAKRGFLKKREGSQLDINTDYLQAEYEVMAQMLHDVKLAQVLKTIDKQHNIADQVKKDAKAEDVDDWRDAVPEGYGLWQPREGNVFYQADSISSRFAEELTMGQFKEIPITEMDVRKILALGAKRKQWVLPNEVIETLDNIFKPTINNPISKGSKSILRGWKVWSLISPRRWFKYNARNLTGDADAVFAGNPAAFLRVPQAVKELYGVYAKDKVMTDNLKDWFERGGMQSTLQAQEMGEINNLKIFRNFLDKKGELKDIPIGLWKKYWKAARLSTDFREAILRYAAYLDYLESMQKNPEGKPKNFGASKREEVMALSDIKDRAFWLSNDLLGAYDKVSVFGQTLRNHWIPFWSWKEVNFKRYFQLYKNAIEDGRSMEYIGKRVFRHLATSPYQAYRLGKLTVKVMSFWGMTVAWNYLRFPKEERELPEDVRNRPHIILGRDNNGKIIYFSRLGAVTDLFEWVGLDNSYEYINDLIDGKMTLKDVAKEMAKSPVNTVVNALSPFVKTPAELLTKQSLFPDAFEPRTIRDEGLHIARSLGLENEYVALSNLPSRGYAESLGQFFYYKVDPGQAAYNDILEEKHRFLKKIGKGSTGFWITPRGNALYHMKLAVRFGDEKAAKKYLLKYINLGGTPEGMKASFKAMNPVFGLSENEKLAFVASLPKKDHKKLVAALKFYNDVLLGQKKGESK